MIDLAFEHPSGGAVYILRAWMGDVAFASSNPWEAGDAFQKANHADLWRVRFDWDGQPIIERVGVK